MTLSKWIEDYCEDNNIELPSGIPDEKTALEFLKLNSSGGGGGGGDSDFSTAKLTIVNTSEYDSMTLDNYFGFPFIDDNSVQCYPLETLAPLQSIEFDIVLYKGTAIGGVFGSGFTFSGNISEDDGMITITGDCTITYTPVLPEP